MLNSHSKDKKILEQVSDIMRLNHYSILPKDHIVIKRFLQMKSRADLKNGETKIEHFVTIPFKPGLRFSQI